MGLNKIIRKSLLLCFLIFSALLFLARDSFSKLDGPGVSATRHDLSLASGTGPWRFGGDGGAQLGTTEVCVYCHTPHSTISEPPLWNKSIRTVTYSMYTTSTFNMGVGLEPVRAIGATSALCMSCHDGIMAMNVVLNAPGSGTRGGVIPLPTGYPNTKLGEVYFPNNPPWNYPGPNISGNYDGDPNVNNLRDEHPISFTYNPVADTEENNFPAITDGAIIGGITNTKYKLYGSGKNQFECSTCHDVHDTASYMDGGTWPDVSYDGSQSRKDIVEVFFLRRSNSDSKMCRDCHRNK